MMISITFYFFTSALIAAHFFRAGNLIVATVCLATPLLFLLRRRWSLMLLQGLAYSAAVCWLWTLWELVAVRRSNGQPWVLAATIIASVAALSVLAGILLRNKSLQERYRIRVD